MKSIVVAALFSLLITRSADADIITFSTSDSRFDNNVNNQGWWSNTSNNFDSNDNYITGFTTFGIIPFGGPTEWRSFFTFDLSTLDLTGQVLLSATLEVVRSLYESSDPTETIAFFDVSADAATLNNNSGMNAAIFNDLGSGTTYGSSMSLNDLDNEQFVIDRILEAVERGDAAAKEQYGIKQIVVPDVSL